MDYGFKIDDQLTSGLRLDRYGNGAENMAGLRPTAYGAVTPESITLVDPASVRPQTWPFPQFVPMSRRALIASSTALYTMIGDTVSEIDADITHSGVWHVADFLGSWFACNGAGLLSCTMNAESGEYEYAWADGAVSSVCSHMESRLITGFIDADGVPRVGYSVAGDITGVKNVPMPFQATELTVLPLGPQIVVAYGNGGVSILRAGQSGDGLINYGAWPTNIPGVSNRSSVAMISEDYHIARDIRGDLWRITPDGAVQFIGGKEFLAGMTHPVLSADNLNREVWISDGSKSYVLTERGLGGPMSHCPNGFVISAGALLSVGLGTQVSFEFVSQLFDMAYRGLKTMSNVHCTSENLSRISVRVDGRTNTTSEPVRISKVVDCAPGGTSFIKAAFVEGKVVINGRIVSGTKGRLSGIEVRWQRNDRRFRRGPAGQPESD